MDFVRPCAIRALSPLAKWKIKSFVENEHSYDYQISFPQRASNQVKLTREWLGEVAGGFKLAVDVGCADGWHTAILAEFCDHVLATDVNHTFINMASDTFRDNTRATFFLADHSFLSKVWSPVNLVSLSGLLTYIPREKEASQLLLRAAEVMPRGGLLLVKDTLRSDASVLRIQRRGNTALYRSESEWTALVQSAGFIERRATNLDQPVDGFFSRFAVFQKP